MHLPIPLLLILLSGSNVHGLATPQRARGIVRCRDWCNKVSSVTAHFSARNDGYDDANPVKMKQYLATCIPGLAQVLAREVDNLGGAINVETSGNAAVIFQGPSIVGLKSLLHLRTVHKLMELVTTTEPEELLLTRDDVHNFIRNNLDIKQLLGNGQGGLLTMSVSVVLNQKTRIPKDINHSHYTALSIKNAVCDVVRELRGDRPDVDVENADVPLVAVLRGAPAGAELSLYRCLHPPGSLHRRGYRGNGAMHKAAMKESMAAGLLLYAGWDEQVKAARLGSNNNDKKQLQLVDPMGGSGSLVLEAAMIAARVPPGLMRIKCGLEGHLTPPVLRWKDAIDENLMDAWKLLLREAAEEAKEGMQWVSNSDAIEIVCNDIHGGALDICSSSLNEAGFSNVVELRQGDAAHLKLDHAKQCFIVTNPPWGVRLDDDMEASWEALRSLIRDSAPANTEAWVLSGNKSATKHLGLKRSQSMVLKTADQDLRWIQYVIHDKSVPAELGDDDIAWEEDTVEGERPKSRGNFSPRKEKPRRKEVIQHREQKSDGPIKTRGYQARAAAMSSYTRKGDNAPMTEREREDRKNSWNL